VADIFGVEPEALNDDRIGRALDAVAPALAGVVGSVGVNAIIAFGIDTSRLHWDMTLISLFGDSRRCRRPVRRAVLRAPQGDHAAPLIAGADELEDHVGLGP
jgi:hypothetical protein